MRILLPALSLLLLLSGCATVDGEQVVSESVVVDDATWDPCTGYADKKLVNPVEMIRKAVAANDIEGIEKGQNKLADLLGQSNLNPIEKFLDVYFNRGELSGRRAMAHRMAADVVMSEMRMPHVVDAVRDGFPIEWLIPGEQTQTLFGHLIPDEPFRFTPEGKSVSSVQFAPTPAAPRQRPAGVALCPHARLTRYQTKVWTGKQEAQETTSNQRDKTSDFSQVQSDQQHSVFQQPQQLIPTPGGRTLLGPITPNAYGPGLNSDATGRPFMWTPQSGGSGHPDPTLRVHPNAYGLGIGMDQYGRPVTPGCMPGWVGPC